MTQTAQAEVPTQIGARLGLRVPDTVRRIVRNPVAAASLAFIGLLVMAALLAPVISIYDPIRSTVDTFARPSLAHPMGTDDLGRDVAARVIWGARTTLYVSLLSVALGIFGGAAIGLVSGFIADGFDLVVQRGIDSMLAFPGIVLAMALVSVLGISTTNALLAIAIVIIPGTSRVVRSTVLVAKANVYIEAAEAIGASGTRIMLRHVLPNIMAPILILISAYLGNAILIEAALSFLGLSTQPPNPSWGLMLSGTGRRYMEIAPWLAIFPGLAISFTVLAFNMLGDVVRDVLDPRLRGS